MAGRDDSAGKAGDLAILTARHRFEMAADGGQGRDRVAARLFRSQLLDRRHAELGQPIEVSLRLRVERHQVATAARRR